MRPVLFEFELFGRSIPVNGYGLFIGFGFVAFVLVISSEARRRGYKTLEEGVIRLLCFMVVGIWAGGKLMFLITNPAAKATLDPGEGFVFYGAMIASIPLVMWRAKAMGMGALALMDILATAAALGHALGRFGCFLAGCCYGHRCDNSWAVTFSQGSGLKGVPLHPVQLYEAGGLLLLFVVLRFVIAPRQTKDGQAVFSYFALYAVLRTITEFFRGDPERKFAFGGAAVGAGDPPTGISTSVLISIVMFVGTLAVYQWMRRSGRLPALSDPSRSARWPT